MSLFGKFSRKKKNKTEFEIDMGGNITAQHVLSINNKSFNIPINISVEQLEEFYFNKQDPKSCEYEPSKDEIKLSKEEFDKVCVFGTIGNDLSDIMFSLSSKTARRGYNNIIIKRTTYEECLKVKNENEKQSFLLNKTASLNNEGKDFEKAGNIEDAIRVYEKNIKLGYPATFSYDRLMILYRKLKDSENEIRVINQAIKVFLNENMERANSAISINPQLKEQILEGLANNEKVMGSNGFYCFTPYDVLRYRNRLLKLKTEK